MLYDLIIIGGGPAGLTAAIYAKRAGIKKMLILEKEWCGGKIFYTPKVENIPGFVEISGEDFANKLIEQVENLEIDIEYFEVTDIVDMIDYLSIHAKYGKQTKQFEAKAIIIATGTEYRTLGLPNEKELIGNGVHFCVTCDGPLYANKTVAVIGGGNTALTDAIELADQGCTVYVIQNLSYFTAEQSLKDKLDQYSNIKTMRNTIVSGYLLNDAHELLGIKLFDVNTNTELPDLFISAVFLAIGMKPETAIYDNMYGPALLDEHKYIIAPEGKTNIPGILLQEIVLIIKLNRLLRLVLLGLRQL